MEYTEKVLNHFKDPKNVGTIQNPSGKGKIGNVSCGDVLELMIKVENERITEAKFKTFGCAAAIATSSILTEMIIGKTLDEALSITHKDIIDNLDGLPPLKIHCSLLGIDALKKAVQDYRSKLYS